MTDHIARWFRRVRALLAPIPTPPPPRRKPPHCPRATERPYTVVVSAHGINFIPRQPHRAQVTR
ncbi:hypothetical protein BLA24_00485 [Streptomyces cinnamoneus]|uniref:Uncharacterized protein n=1 Tax=Streptomyces cinnamoneus TaxID=53446 RepID=A0A2G1XQD2_STRCJ|nr:hypothetical protein [Streptomyces cinnamoneus]PHQ53446.1 hypothetical protein BLA24_00485 [Streptomyces cinnamoneus]PPT12751.1 hypothetical protein CYQ11_07495 [Streptomyces cinnamoneus]